jgi:hypothetical protein
MQNSRDLSKNDRFFGQIRSICPKFGHIDREQQQWVVEGWSGQTSQDIASHSRLQKCQTEYIFVSTTEYQLVIANATICSATPLQGV